MNNRNKIRHGMSMINVNLKGSLEELDGFTIVDHPAKEQIDNTNDVNSTNLSTPSSSEHSPTSSASASSESLLEDQEDTNESQEAIEEQDTWLNATTKLREMWDLNVVPVASSLVTFISDSVKVPSTRPVIKLLGPIMPGMIRDRPRPEIPRNNSHSTMTKSVWVEDPFSQPWRQQEQSFKPVAMPVKQKPKRTIKIDDTFS